ncbi:serpin family protein [Candidatus Formimonas warabiya]|uniref:Proteinase IV n=1 Tax=Formimonas warabiya TaxID=1761012 RepID=A0A3G1KTG1_FORW1|nr:serpin family protein [Candidatus Formimonas warabiya]ATW25445.1 proteinase IV [Candidatus Formimonas warabiya]
MRKCLCLIFFLFLMMVILSGCSGKALSFGQNDDFDLEQIGTATVEGNSRFAFDLFRQLEQEDGDQNVFISPFSISTALTMTYQGAGTTTKEAMAKALGYTGIDDEELNRSYRNLIRYLRQSDNKIELNIGNSLWVREGEDIKEDFLAVNREIFDAPVTPLDFSQEKEVDRINQWISDATKKKIEKMIEPPIPADVVMYLINAIYFKGEWADQFDPKQTISASFQAGDGSNQEVMMMSKNGKVEYGQGENYKAVRLPYGGGKAAMYCILPREDISVHDFIGELDEEHWQRIRESISERDGVQLRLPRFKLEYGIKNLNDSLKALGMGEAFTAEADFSGIRDGLCISRVLHKAVIEVNEKGSEAAAATVVEVKESAALEPLTFIADRPFVFMIADDETGTILFMGKMWDVK